MNGMGYSSAYFFPCGKRAARIEMFFAAAVAFALLTISGCRSNTPWPEAEFPLVSDFDTLAFSVEDAWDETAQVIMPNPNFYRAVPFEMWEEISEFADTTESRVYPRGRISVDARYDAYWVDIRYVWFIQQSLWVYDKREKQFSDRITVASWYGGDGGQVRVAAWAWRAGETLQIVERTQERSLRYEGEEIQSRYTEDVALWKFKSGAIYPVSVQDSAYWIQKFAIARMD